MNTIKAIIFAIIFLVVAVIVILLGINYKKDEQDDKNDGNFKSPRLVLNIPYYVYNLSTGYTTKLGINFDSVLVFNPNLFGDAVTWIFEKHDDESVILRYPLLNKYVITLDNNTLALGDRENATSIVLQDNGEITDVGVTKYLSYQKAVEGKALTWVSREKATHGDSYKFMAVPIENSPN